MGVKIGELDIGTSLVNSMINIDVILTVLLRKGLLTQEEYDRIRKEIIEKWKKEHPKLFK